MVGGERSMRRDEGASDRGASGRGRGIVAGLTGGIASGKSTVARLFAELGAIVISADQVARDVVQPGMPASKEIQAAFGDEVFLPDGHIDRRRLGTIVFADAEKRRLLENITHPRIREAMAAQITEAAATGTPVIAEIPLLFEGGASLALVDVVIVVYVDRDLQLQRLMTRDGLSASEAEARIAAQLPLDDKVARADYVIDNRGDEARTREQVVRIWQEFARA